MREPFIAATAYRLPLRRIFVKAQAVSPSTNAQLTAMKIIAPVVMFPPPE